MLLTLLENGFSKAALIDFLLFLPVMLLSLPAHELAHGWMANKMGDPTAKNLGRLSLNPARHLDPIGTLMMLILGIGWAKPVPINTRNFQKPRRGMALTALAGPMMNLLLCLICRILLFLSELFLIPYTLTSFAAYLILALQIFLYLMSYYNAALCVFNLIPIPPLDGSRILTLLLPAKWYWNVMKYERYIMYGFLLLVFMLSRAGISLIDYPVNGILHGIDSLLNLIAGVFLPS